MSFDAQFVGLRTGPTVITTSSARMATSWPSYSRSRMCARP